MFCNCLCASLVCSTVQRSCKIVEAGVDIFATIFFDKKMPRCVRKLKDAALLCIAQNIELWAESVPENAESYLYLLSPFEMLGRYIFCFNQVFHCALKGVCLQQTKRPVLPTFRSAE